MPNKTMGSTLTPVALSAFYITGLNITISIPLNKLQCINWTSLSASRCQDIWTQGSTYEEIWIVSAPWCIICWTPGKNMKMWPNPPHGWHCHSHHNDTPKSRQFVHSTTIIWWRDKEWSHTPLKTSCLIRFALWCFLLPCISAKEWIYFWWFVASLSCFGLNNYIPAISSAASANHRHSIRPVNGF